MQPINAVTRLSRAEDFCELERQRLQALVQRDMSLAWQLHSADFQLITSTGYMYTRDQYLGEVESGLLNYSRWEPAAITVRLHEKMALLRYQAQLEVDSGAGQVLALRCWHMDSYELIDDLWQVVWSQATAIR